MNISRCKSILKLWYAEVCYVAKLACFLHYCAYFFRYWFKVSRVFTSWTQDMNWKNIRLSEDVQDLFWTSYMCVQFTSFVQEVWLNEYVRSKWSVNWRFSRKIKALGTRCNIFMRMIMLPWSRMETFCVQIYFILVFLSLKLLFVV